MSEHTCPVCDEPYLKTRQTDDRTSGTFNESLPQYRDRGDYIVCYDVAAYPVGYHGFTLYFHPPSITVLEEKWDDDKWQEVGRFARGPEAIDVMDSKELDQDNHELRIREVRPGK